MRFTTLCEGATNRPFGMRFANVCWKHILPEHTALDWEGLAGARDSGAREVLPTRPSCLVEVILSCYCDHYTTLEHSRSRLENTREACSFAFIQLTLPISPRQVKTRWW